MSQADEWLFNNGCLEILEITKTAVGNGKVSSFFLKRNGLDFGMMVGERAVLSSFAGDGISSATT